jgi:hypothetical protein
VLVFLIAVSLLTLTGAVALTIAPTRGGVRSVANLDEVLELAQ